MRFVAHRHSQYTLDKYFAGDYPGSKARIRHSATLIGIAIQALLPFIPGTVVEVMPVVEKKNAKLHGAEVEKEYQSQLGDGEMDPDLIDAIDAIAHAGAAVAAEQAEALEGTFDDMVRDLSSWRWLHFYSVPKVKFTLHLCFYPSPNPNPNPIPIQVKFTVHFCCYVAYMFYAAFVLMRQDSAEGEISGYEIFFWVWALSRQAGEVYELDDFSFGGVRMYIRDFWNQLDTGTFLMIMAAAAVRINNSTREEEWAGSFVDVLPRNIYALAVLLIFLRVLPLQPTLTLTLSP